MTPQGDQPVLEGAAVLGATRLPLCARRSSERLARQRLPVLVQLGTPVRPARGSPSCLHAAALLAVRGALPLLKRHSGA
jgi:hypothetical protein